MDVKINNGEWLAATLVEIVDGVLRVVYFVDNEEGGVQHVVAEVAMSEVKDLAVLS